MKKHRNKGLQKICGCARRSWAICPHAWHFSFQWAAGTKRKTGGKHYRFSLDSHFKRHIDSKSEAEDLAADLRKAIKAGTFGKATPKGDMTVRQLADEYEERYIRVHKAARAAVFEAALMSSAARQLSTPQAPLLAHSATGPSRRSSPTPSSGFAKRSSPRQGHPRHESLSGLHACDVGVGARSGARHGDTVSSE